MLRHFALLLVRSVGRELVSVFLQILHNTNLVLLTLWGPHRDRPRLRNTPWLQCWQGVWNLDRIHGLEVSIL